MAQPDDSDTFTPKQLHLAGFLVWCGVAFVVLAALGAMLSGLAHQWGWWRFQTGFTVLQWSAYGALGAGAIGLVAFVSALLMRRGRLMLGALAVMLAALGIVAVPMSHLQRAGSVPAIHDITTDPQDPPQFVAVAPAREQAMNAVAYPGPQAAQKQRQAYPGIEPLVLPAPQRQVFDAALAEAREAGWTIAAAEPQAGRIEATARTFWFGFEDDVAIRLTETADGATRVDVRSASRVGISDLGTNARRIRDFLQALEARLAAAG